MTEYRVAIVGCGSRSRDHIHAYDSIHNAKVVACCAPHAERRDVLAAEFGLHPYANIRTMLAQERPDIVHLVTWPDTRVELMTAVSEMNVPLCTVEKPIAIGTADWRALCALEASSKTHFAVCHQVRWQPYLLKCQQAVRSGALGPVKFLDISAGMNISGQGTHTLNYGRSLIGDPQVVRVAGTAYGWDTSDRGHPAPAASATYLTFDNGVRALWTSGPISPRAGDPATTWQHVRAAAYCEHGRVNYEEFGQWEVVSPDNIEQGDYGGMQNWRNNNILAQAGFHQAMFAWLEDETYVPGTNLKASLHEWKVVLAMYTSALERRPIEMANFEPEDNLFHRVEKQLGGAE